MHNFIIQFFNSLNNPPTDITQLIKAGKHSIGYKGYGTPELEMNYMHKVFRYIQSHHPTFVSFSWVQNNCYNDEYYHFELSSFTINDTLDVESDITFYFEHYDGEKIESDISFNWVNYPDLEEIEYAKENNIQINEGGLYNEHWDAYSNFLKKKYKHLEAPCLKMLSFIKLLEINFSMYYFLYTFGNGVEVKFNNQGVTVTKLDENDIDGSPLGIGMDLEDL